MTTPVTDRAPNSPIIPAGATGGEKPVLSSDFETFLKMLTAQARYQDPLEPIDSTEYAAQLAQFSMVEQQVQTNEALSVLMERIGASNAASLAGWIGMEAKASVKAEFRGQPIVAAPTPAPDASEAFLVVRDSQGVEVDRHSIATTGDPVRWTGADATGQTFPHGLYSFQTESFRNGNLIDVASSQIYARVVEAQLDGTQVTLVLSGGQKVAADAVSAIREPV